jgi:hypothetical protein
MVDVNDITATPFDAPYTFPPAFTVAMPVLSLAHTPPAGVAFVIDIDCPWHTDDAPIVGDRGFTVTV